MVLEFYIRQRNAGVPVPNFYKLSVKDDNGVRYLDLEGIRNGDNKPEYIKLHGSIDWWENDDGDIIESYPRDHPYETLVRRSIIYPIYEKHVSKDPFFTLYQYFRSQLMIKEDLTLVIGYSFRDPSVNNAFMDWLNYKDNSRLIVVSRVDYQDRIREVFGNQGDRIEFIEQYFGGEDFERNLIEVLTTP